MNGLLWSQQERISEFFVLAICDKSPKKSISMRNCLHLVGLGMALGKCLTKLIDIETPSPLQVGFPTHGVLSYVRVEIPSWAHRAAKWTWMCYLLSLWLWMCETNCFELLPWFPHDDGPVITIWNKLLCPLSGFCYYASSQQQEYV